MQKSYVSCEDETAQIAEYSNCQYNPNFLLAEIGKFVQDGSCYCFHERKLKNKIFSLVKS